MFGPVVRLIAWGAGLSYISTWAMLLWFMTDGAFIRANPSCDPILLWDTLAFWSCGEPALAVTLANMINVALALTLWAPAFLAIALNDPAGWVIALPILVTHLVGLPSAAYVALRLGLGLWRLSHFSANLIAGRA